MTVDFEIAAVRAMETLIRFNVTTAPIDPLPMLKKIPGVLVISYAEMAQSMGEERQTLMSAFGSSNQDASTSVMEVGGKLRYVVMYNQRLPLYMLQRALARELGHIVIGHDGSRPEEVRTKEAKTFARYLLCPRPLIKALQESDYPLTIEVFGNVTGCYERCLRGIRKTPGVRIPAALNRLVRDQFADYIANFLDFQAVMSPGDESALADFGTFMDNYEE